MYRNNVPLVKEDGLKKKRDELTEDVASDKKETDVSMSSTNKNYSIVSNKSSGENSPRTEISEEEVRD